MLINANVLIDRLNKLIEKSKDLKEPLNRRLGILDAESEVLKMMQEEGDRVYEEYKKRTA